MYIRIDVAKEKCPTEEVNFGSGFVLRSHEVLWFEMVRPSVHKHASDGAAGVWKEARVARWHLAGTVYGGGVRKREANVAETVSSARKRDSSFAHTIVAHPVES